MSRQHRLLALVAILTLAMVMVAACASSAPEPTKEPEVAEPDVPAGKYSEAPMLAELVKAGTLPPVDARLPSNPLVGVTNIPADWLVPEIGEYGGTLHLISIDAGSVGHDASWLHNEPWFYQPGLQHDNTNVPPNVFASFEVNAEATEFTIHMREGMKYSDGSPFTTEDVLYWYEDVLLNEKLTPVVASKWRNGRDPAGEVMKLVALDDYTFKISFADPYGGFPANFNYAVPDIPSKEYASQFHADYTPLADLESLIAAAGFEAGEWWRLYGQKMDWVKQYETGMPNFSPWTVTSESPTRWTFERNPYYFKVDAAGNQLPYIDYLEVNIVADVEAATIELIAGNVDMARRPVTPASMSLYKENEARGGYTTLLLKQHASLGEVFFNLTNEDPWWREVVQNVEFRRALSMAIDRDRIIDAVYFGIAGQPRTIPAAAYDPVQASQILDEIGMDEKDADGCRLTPSGASFSIPFELAPFTGEEIPVAEMVSGFWNEVGICTTIKTFETGVWIEAHGANQNHAFTWWYHYPRHPWHEPGDYVGIAWQKTYAPLWYNWYQTGGQEGEEPPQAYIDLRHMQDEMFSTPDLQRQKELWELMKQNISENVWLIPIVDDVLGPLPVSADLGNVPEEGYAIENATAAEMFFFRSAENRQ